MHATTASMRTSARCKGDLIPFRARCRADDEAQKRFGNVPMRSLMEAYPNVMWGEQKEESPRAVDPEEQVRVFRTGDLGRLSCQGLLLAGRLDLQAKIGGALPCSLRNTHTVRLATRAQQHMRIPHDCAAAAHQFPQHGKEACMCGVQV